MYDKGPDHIQKQFMKLLETIEDNERRIESNEQRIESNEERIEALEAALK